MAKFNVEGAQNVEVSVKIPCEKPLKRQLEIMEEYTRVHRAHAHSSRAAREAACLRVIYPEMFRSIDSQDRIAGRLDFLPIGFGTVTSVGGVGHYCVFAKLRAFEKEIVQEDPACADRVEALYQYWLDHDLKTRYCNEVLTDPSIGPFLDPAYPLLVTARLSGMMLDYPKLLENGVSGLKAQVMERLNEEPDNDFLRACVDCLDLVTECADALREKALRQAEALPEDAHKRCKELYDMADVLKNIRTDKPKTFPEALQLLWLYALLAGVINYGRLDDFLGPYLAADLDAGRLTEEEALNYIRSLWTMIENRRTTVNGRVIVGGRGRKDPAAADRFMRLCLKVCGEVRYVEPQFTLRVDADTTEETWQQALTALGRGATYPTLYNDQVHVPAVAYGMRVDMETATRYVPFGCTEFVLWGQSTGTPNTLINLVKILNIYMNGGVDPFDDVYRAGAMRPRDIADSATFEDFYAGYKELLDYFMDRAAQSQYRSYQVMNEHVSFLFNSILMDDCIARGRALLDGGVRYLGGTCETYGNINASDSLVAIKQLVYEQKKYTLAELRDALNANFEGYAHIQRDCLRCDKYGNDISAADDMANDLYEYVAKGIRERGIAIGMQYFLIVISNNSFNTEWGLHTAASPDGRLSGMYMNPANNPQGGADTQGPTALLNSLARFDARYHAGSVQNIKFSPGMFNGNLPLIEQLIKVYFAKGGCHLMVTVVDRGELEDAMTHPEEHGDLIVRVAGYSAVFVDLDRSVQEELLSRSLYDEERCLA